MESQINETKLTHETLLAEIQEITAGLREVRIGMQEDRKSQNDIAEWRKEAEREMKETRRRMKETDRQMKETDRQMKETDRRLGLYDNRYGKMLEHMVQPNLVKGFRKLGFNVTKAHQNTRITDEDDKIITEIDFTLEDGNKVILVEVKSKLTIEDIADHVARMVKVKNIANQHEDRRIYLGAIAGLIINDKEREYALKQGFYVIQPSGNTFAITVPEGAYSPKEW